MKHTISQSNVSRETFENINKLFIKNESKLREYANLLLWWNKRINLVSRSSNKSNIIDHIKHSLFLSSLNIFSQTDDFIDAGTGGGLPGLPLSICFQSKHFVLNDIINKKIIAIKQIINDLNLENVTTFSGPISDISISKEELVIISKHAFKINDLYYYIDNLSWKAMILLKGCDFKKELSAIQNPLKIICHNIEYSTNNSFYTNKCILDIQRMKK